jgi:adenine-specific DNA-methyltransferase
VSNDGRNVLDQAIAQIADEAVRSRVAREVELLRGSRRFGLVFDHHLAESARLPKHPIRKGVRVGLRDESKNQTWLVAGFTDTTRSVARLGEDGGDVAVHDLVVVRGRSGRPGFQLVAPLWFLTSGPAPDRGAALTTRRAFGHSSRECHSGEGG